MIAVELKMEENHDAKTEHYDIELGSSSTSVVTAVRVRPASQNELKYEQKSIASVDGGEPEEMALNILDPTFFSRKRDYEQHYFERQFKYDYCFWQDHSQLTVYEKAGKPLLKHALDGFNCCVLAYGQTGSGKTYTMIGDESKDVWNTNANQPTEHAGIIPRLCQGLLEAVKNGVKNGGTSEGAEAASGDVGALSPIPIGSEIETSLKSPADKVDNPYKLVEYDIRASFYEIYNEKVFDLLVTTDGNSGKDKPDGHSMRVREHPDEGAYVENLTMCPIENLSQAASIMNIGLKQRVVAETRMNAMSSRSHAVFTLYLRQKLVNYNKSSNAQKQTILLKSKHKNTDGSNIIQRYSKITLVDLAGSERVSLTGATGERLVEANNINKSLSSLSDVIKALSDRGYAQSKDKDEIIGPDGTPQKIRIDSTTNAGFFIPYRNSVLTWLLKDCLGGNARTSMLANVGPSENSYSETMSTLRYVERAKLIVNTARINETSTDPAFVLYLQKQVAGLREKIVELNKENSNKEMQNQQNLLNLENELEKQFVKRTVELRDELFFYKNRSQADSTSSSLAVHSSGNNLSITNTEITLLQTELAQAKTLNEQQKIIINQYESQEGIVSEDASAAGDSNVSTPGMSSPLPTNSSSSSGNRMKNIVLSYKREKSLMAQQYEELLNKCRTLTKEIDGSHEHIERMELHKSSITADLQLARADRNRLKSELANKIEEVNTKISELEYFKARLSGNTSEYKRKCSLLEMHISKAKDSESILRHEREVDMDKFTEMLAEKQKLLDTVDERLAQAVEDTEIAFNEKINDLTSKLNQIHKERDRMRHQLSGKIEEHELKDITIDKLTNEISIYKDKEQEHKHICKELEETHIKLNRKTLSLKQLQSEHDEHKSLLVSEQAKLTEAFNLLGDTKNIKVTLENEVQVLRSDKIHLQSQLEEIETKRGKQFLDLQNSHELAMTKAQSEISDVNENLRFHINKLNIVENELNHWKTLELSKEQELNLMKLQEEQNQEKLSKLHNDIQIEKENEIQLEQKLLIEKALEDKIQNTLNETMALLETEKISSLALASELEKTKIEYESKLLDIKAKSGDIERLSHEKEHLSMENATLKTSVHSTQELLEKEKHETDSIKRSLLSLETELDRSHLSESDLTKDVKRLEAMLSDEEAEMKSNNNKFYDELKISENNLKEEIKSHKFTKLKHNDEIASQLALLDEKTKYHEDEVAGHHERLNKALDSHVNEIETMKKNHENAIQSLHSNHDFIVKELQIKYDQILNDNKSLYEKYQTENEHHKQDIIELNNKLSKSDDSIKTCKSENDQMNEEYIQNQSELLHYKERYHKLELTNNILETNVKENDNIVKQLISKHEEENIEIEELRKYKARHQHDKEMSGGGDVDVIIDMLRTQVSDAEDRIEELENNKIDLEKQLDDMKTGDGTIASDPFMASASDDSGFASSAIDNAFAPSSSANDGFASSAMDDAFAPSETAPGGFDSFAPSTFATSAFSSTASNGANHIDGDDLNSLQQKLNEKDTTIEILKKQIQELNAGSRTNSSVSKIADVSVTPDKGEKKRSSILKGAKKGWGVIRSIAGVDSTSSNKYEDEQSTAEASGSVRDTEDLEQQLHDLREELAERELDLKNERERNGTIISNKGKYYTAMKAKQNEWKIVHSMVRWESPDNLDKLNTLLNTKPEIMNMQDPRSLNVPLHISSQNGHEKATEMFINNNCNLNAKNCTGQTALHMAMAYDYYTIAQMLLKAGANANEINNDGYSAITGIDGTKTMGLVALAAAENETHVRKALSLIHSESTITDKATYIHIGLSKKRGLIEDNEENGHTVVDGWGRANQALFTEIAHKLTHVSPPEPHPIDHTPPEVRELNEKLKEVENLSKKNMDILMDEIKDLTEQLNQSDAAQEELLQVHRLAGTEHATSAAIFEEKYNHAILKHKELENEVSRLSTKNGELNKILESASKDVTQDNNMQTDLQDTQQLLAAAKLNEAELNTQISTLQTEIDTLSRKLVESQESATTASSSSFRAIENDSFMPSPSKDETIDASAFTSNNDPFMASASDDSEFASSAIDNAFAPSSSANDGFASSAMDDAFASSGNANGGFASSTVGDAFAPTSMNEGFDAFAPSVFDPAPSAAALDPEISNKELNDLQQKLDENHKKITDQETTLLNTIEELTTTKNREVDLMSQIDQMNNEIVDLKEQLQAKNQIELSDKVDEENNDTIIVKDNQIEQLNNVINDMKIKITNMEEIAQNAVNKHKDSELEVKKLSKELKKFKDKVKPNNIRKLTGSSDLHIGGGEDDYKVHTHDEDAITEALVLTKMDLANAQAELEILEMDKKNDAIEIAELHNVVQSLRAQIEKI